MYCILCTSICLDQIKFSLNYISFSSSSFVLYKFAIYKGISSILNAILDGLDGSHFSSVRLIGTNLSLLGPKRIIILGQS